jgi:IclR family pca regulon transcriptional regulator
MSINLMAGSRLPATCASMGRVLLAQLDDDDVLTLIAASERKAFTPYTRTDPQALIEEIRRVRSQGYAVIDQELELGLCSIAVPLCDSRGKVVAAVNIGAPAARVAASAMADTFLEPLQVLARQLRPLLR